MEMVGNVSDSLLDIMKATLKCPAELLYDFMTHWSALLWLRNMSEIHATNNKTSTWNWTSFFPKEIFLFKILASCQIWACPALSAN